MDADQVLNNWEQCLNSGDLQGIVNLYSTDAVLWGTFSKVIRNNHKLIKEYFDGLFKKKQLKVQFNSQYSRSYSDVYIYSGEYEFSFMEDEKVCIPARYTIVVYENNTGEFKIVEHHSSLFPG